MAAFSLNLHRKIEPGLVVCGKFDGSHACLVVATSAGNILVHSPHRQPPINPEGHENLERRLEWNGEVAELQIGRQVKYNLSFFFSFSILIIIFLFSTLIFFS